MPTINIIDNNRNMTGVAPCGCAGNGGGSSGVPFQTAASAGGAMMNSLGAPGAGLGAMSGMMSGTTPAGQA